MDEFFETQMIKASNNADKADASDAEESVRMSQGQTPTIDAETYDPKELRDGGYPLSNPTAEPNKHTKPNARMYAGRDAHDGKPVTKPTAMPENPAPQTSRYALNMDPIYSGLSAAQNAFTVETGISKSFEQMIKYTNSLEGSDGKEANRVKWSTSDRLEQIGFDHVYNSERTAEGIDDKGLDGLQMMMASQIMRGVTDFEGVTAAIGDTGAAPEQLEETWNKAVDAYERASQGISQGLPTDEDSAKGDPRYLGAAAILNDAIGNKGKASKEMSEQELYDEGMFLIDMIKGNPFILAATVGQANDDPQIADAINFLLDSDEGMDTTFGDFGRGVLAAASDPLSYVGIGLANRAIVGGARTAGVRAALVGVEGAVLGGSYGNLMDHGFQNIDVLSGREEEFNVSRNAMSTGIGATAGFIFGSAFSGLSDGAQNLLSRFVQRKSGTTPPPTAREEFAGMPIPDNVVGENELRLRRTVRNVVDKAKETEVKNVDLYEEAVAEVREIESQFLSDLVVDSLTDGVPNKTSVEIVNEMEMALEVLTDSGILPDTEQAAAINLLTEMSKYGDQTVEMVNRVRKNFATVEDTGILSPTAPAGKLSLVKDEPAIRSNIQAEDDFRKDFQNKVGEYAKARQLDIETNDFRFIDEDIVTSKHSGKKFRILSQSWNKVRKQSEYLVETLDGNESHMMAEWGMVGGKPNLSVVPKWTPDMPQPDRKKIVQAMYRDELRELADRQGSVKDVIQVYQDRLDPPMFDLSTGINVKERMTRPEQDFWSEIFNSKQDVMELLDEVPSADYVDGILTIKGYDIYSLLEYIERTVQLHDGPRSALPLTIRNGTFIEKRLKDFK
jgi:hypothetical protein